ncbi:unnamed protein product [Allacma fusca]|uniref:Farnesyl pyrophosphate synthase n=1 Tax=Allacma fusca TaxID=39272 RepID=A0A8J2P0Q0_9HEXA|nr:unnamed protein product [Allacma fusca]
MSVQDKGSTILISKELYDDFISFFPKLKAEILTHWTSRKLPHFAIAYYNELMCETVFRGKHMRAQLFLLATHYIFEEVSGESKESFLGLAWIFEILQTASIIGDDITDNSTMRRGQKCWHLNDHVKLIAVNDMVLLENICFFLLKKYFSTHPQYLNLVEAFHDSTLRLCIGQGLDLLAENSIHPER